ncbi:uncharacterized protein LAESUDRAFT_681661, partial [Laetiporus sulphureus 93-53]
MANMQSAPDDLHTMPEVTTQQAVDELSNAGMQTLVQSPSQLDHGIHNSMLPINRLSNELLVMIFICTLDSKPIDELTDKSTDEATDESMDESTDEATNLLAISYVCHRWRTLAISTPLLYSRINLQSWNTRSRRKLLNILLKR